MKVLELTQKGIFFDCIKFVNKKVGYILSDPIDTKPYLLKTTDAGKTWHRIDKNKFPDLSEGDASFAASNSCISLYKNHIWFNTQIRIYHSTNGGESWQIIDTPFQKSASMGIFGMKFISETEGYLVGGDYLSKIYSTLQFCFTQDAGKTWIKNHSDNEIGLTEGIAKTKNNAIVKASLQGIYQLIDARWTLLDATPFHAIDSHKNTCIAVGGNGKIAVFEIE